jgi:hypothetical protein
MLHPAVVTGLAATEPIHIPTESRAGTLLTKVACKRTYIQKANKGKEFTNSILKRGSGETPFVVGFQSKARFGAASCTLLNSVSFARG